MKLKTSLFAIIAIAVLFFVTAPVFAAPGPHHVHVFVQIHVPAGLAVNNLQVNDGDMDAETTVTGTGYYGDSQIGGDDVSISSAAIGNNLSINISSSSVGVVLNNDQDTHGDMDAKTTVSGMAQNAGDDASISAAAIGNNASITLGGLDL